MKYWYSVEVQMSGENERTPELDAKIGDALGFLEKHIDERELHRMTAVFNSETPSHEMKQKIISALRDLPSVLYVDAMWGSGYESTPQRFTVWQYGMVQNYRSRVVFDEV